MYEFELDFVIDTGALGVTYSGSGVHLNRDVTVSLALLDPQGQTVTNDYELINNPLISRVSFDIIDTGGNVIYPNFKSGTTSRSITVSALENEKIFGTYVKDFGIQTTVANTVNNDLFVCKFFAYANTPVISNHYFRDGSPESGFDPAIFSGARLDEIEVGVELSGNPVYINLDRYDIYYSSIGTGDIQLPEVENKSNAHNPYFLYSHTIQTELDTKIIRIQPVGLEYYVNYYFAVVPYSAVGSGEAIYFGPAMFTSAITGVAPVIISTEEINIVNGSETGNISLITGNLIEAGISIIDTIPSGRANLAMYDFQAKTFDADLGEYVYSHTQLKVVLDQAGLTGSALYEEVIYNPYIDFTVDTAGTDYIVYADNSYSGGLYKALRTLL